MGPKHANIEIDQDLLRQLWPDLTLRALAYRFGCSVMTIHNRASKLGLPPKQGIRKTSVSGKSRAGEFSAPRPAPRVRVSLNIVPGITMARLMAGR